MRSTDGTGAAPAKDPYWSPEQANQDPKAAARARAARAQREWRRGKRAQLHQAREEARESLAKAALAQLGRQPESLEEWFPTQTVFRGWKELAKAIGVTPNAVYVIRRGRVKPTERTCRKLYEITSLECFNPLAGWPPWAKNLHAEAMKYVDSLKLGRRKKVEYRRCMAIAFDRLLSRNVAAADEISPAVLLKEPGSHRPSNYAGWALALFANFMVAQGHWTPTVRREFRKYPLCTDLIEAGSDILKQLTVRCGLSPLRIRLLKRSQIDENGIGLEGGRRIEFGDDWHHVSHSSLKLWLDAAEPTDYVFFRQSRPLDRNRPVRADWIYRTLKRIDVSCGRGRVVPRDHLVGDMERFGPTIALYRHALEVHGLSRQGLRGIWRQMTGVAWIRQPIVVRQDSATTRRKPGPEKRDYAATESFRVGKRVEDSLPKFRELCSELRKLPKRVRAHPDRAATQLKGKRYSPREIEGASHSPGNPVRAARQFVTLETTYEYDTVAQYHREFRASMAPKSKRS